MRPVLVAVCVLLIASVAFAQSDRGTVTGTISDQTNAVIPGASIVAANTENGTRFETISTETGNYTLTQLPAGMSARESRSRSLRHCVSMSRLR